MIISMNRKEFPVWKTFLQKKTGTAPFLQMEGRQRQGKRKQKLIRNKEREISEGRTRTEELPRKRISIQNLSQ